MRKCNIDRHRYCGVQRVENDEKNRGFVSHTKNCLVTRHVTYLALFVSFFKVLTYRKTHCAPHRALRGLKIEPEVATLPSINGAEDGAIIAHVTGEKGSTVEIRNRSIDDEVDV